jgi:hypothetical protein
MIYTKRRLRVEYDYLKAVGVRQYRRWRRLRNDVVKQAKCCMACGYKKELEAHHILPRHIKPELALTWNNLVVLCRDCHFHLGHWCNFKNYNPEIVKLAGVFAKARLKQAKQK